LVNSCDEAILLSEQSLDQQRQAILDHHLDLLVFGEIGMSLSTYLLAFSRLATKSLVFWGHAITSGIIDFSVRSETDADKDRDTRGGPDYFISSVLFESHLVSPLQQQQRYSERLILQEGLTTYFEDPEPPFSLEELRLVSPDNEASASSPHSSVNLFQTFHQKLSFLASILSPIHLKEGTQSSLAYLEQLIDGMDHREPRLYGVPQTLYKLSPMMIDCMLQVLTRDPHSFLLVPMGSDQGLASRAIHHLKESFDGLAARVLFLRQMKVHPPLTRSLL
jgi:hypothetical protein